MLAEFSLHNPLDLVPSVHNISTEYPIVVDEKVCNIITLYVSFITMIIYIVLAGSLSCNFSQLRNQ